MKPIRFFPVFFEVLCVRPTWMARFGVSDLDVVGIRSVALNPAHC
jgi:hypothetical protein